MSNRNISLLAQSIIDAHELLMNDPDLSNRVKDRIALTMIGLPELASEVLAAAVPQLPPVTIHTVPLLHAKGPTSFEGGGD